LFVQIIVVFATTVIVDGLNAEFWMKTSFNPGSDALVQLFKIPITAIRKAMPTDNLLFEPINVFMMFTVSNNKHQAKLFVQLPKALPYLILGRHPIAVEKPVPLTSRMCSTETAFAFNGQKR
jgi:hypothetical protein